MGMANIALQWTSAVRNFRTCGSHVAVAFVRVTSLRVWEGTMLNSTTKEMVCNYDMVTRYTYSCTTCSPTLSIKHFYNGNVSTLSDTSWSCCYIKENDETRNIILQMKNCSWSVFFFLTTHYGTKNKKPQKFMSKSTFRTAQSDIRTFILSACRWTDPPGTYERPRFPNGQHAIACRATLSYIKTTCRNMHASYFLVFADTQYATKYAWVVIRH